MSKKVVHSNSQDLLDQIVFAMQDKKARNIISLDLNNIPDAIANYFVICHAPSSTQVDAIYNNVIDMVQKNCDTKPFHREGNANSEWILIDYFDIVVHIFKEDIRTFYKLEQLWADAKLKGYDSEK